MNNYGWGCGCISRDYLDDGQFIDKWLRYGRGPVKDQLQGLICGDTKELNVIPEIPELRSGPSRTITKAWLAIKSPATAADATENVAWTSAGCLQSITTTNVAGIGQIINNSEGSPELRFDLTNANTVALTPHKTYHFSIQVKMSDNALYEVEIGKFDTAQQIAVDVS